MDQNKVMDFMRKLSGSPDSMKKIEKLLQLSVQAMETVKLLQSAKPEERDEIRNTFLNTQKQIGAEYEKVLAEMGLTKEMLEEYTANPKNFSPENWAFLEAMKNESKQPEMAPRKSSSKKGKKAKFPSKVWLSA